MNFKSDDSMNPDRTCQKMSIEKNTLKGKKYFLDFLTVKLAPVITKVKPASLLVFCDIQKVESVSMRYLWNTYHEEAMSKLRLSFVQLLSSKDREVILFYDLQELSRILSIPARRDYLSRLGYKPEWNVYDNLIKLKDRFQERLSPDEVGLFLGYPLKDVKGFMEKGILPLTCCDRWKIFGDAKESLYLIRLHRIIEATFSRLIRKKRDPIKYVEKIRNYCLEEAIASWK